MRRLLILLALTFGVPALAQDSGTRFAIFIPQKVIETSARAQKVFSELTSTQAALQAKFNAKVEEMKKLEQQLKSPALSEDGRAKVQREFQDGEVALKRFQEDGQTELQKVQQKAFGQFEQEIKPIIDAVSKEWKLQVILQWQNGLYIAVDEQWLFAFSLEVAKRYDAQYDGGAKPAAAAPKAGTSAPAKPAAPAPKPAAPAKK